MSPTAPSEAPPAARSPLRPKDRNDRIAIIGAGPAGLATAWFLKQNGFRNVTVFERHGRVGGLCFTINDGCRAFDLGANYITLGYRETRKLARAVGAKTYRARPYIAVRIPESGEGPLPPPGELPWLEMTDVVREVRDSDGNPVRDPDGSIRRVGWVRFAWAIVRFFVERWKVRGAIDRPNLDRIHQRPDLCVSFGEWLRARGLEDLRSLFSIPITLMGYGEIDEIAAPYALTYMSLGTFASMVIRQVPLVGLLFPWPRRFVLGFQRMWEALSWRLDVRHDVEVKEIRRYPKPLRSIVLDGPPGDGVAPEERHPIRIDLTHPVGIFNKEERNCATLWFDHLIVAAPRVHALGETLDLDEREHTPMRKVKPYGFCMTTFHPEPGFKPPRPVVCVLPFKFEEDPLHNPPRPWAVVQLWGEETPMLQCYTRLPSDMTGPQLQRDQLEKVMEGAERLVIQLGGRRAGSRDLHDRRMEHYEQWPYFGHVGAEEMRDGFFSKLEAMQGYRNTYWVGGWTNFELVEVIVRAAKELVDKHFVGRA